MIRSSYSQLKDFAMCPEQWRLSRKYEPKDKNDAAVLGSAFHAAAARAYAQKNVTAGLDYLNALVDSVPKDSFALPGLCTMRAAFDLFGSKVLCRDFEEFDVLEVEEEHKIDLPGAGELTAIIDLVVQHRSSGIKYIVEHKYKSDFDEGLPERDDQSTIYAAARLKKYGHLLPTLYNVVRKPLYKQKANEPAMEFGGRTFVSMMDEEQGFSYHPTGYKSRFLVRMAYSRGPAHLREAMARIRAQMSVMEKIQNGTLKAWLSPGDHCRWCPVRTLCPIEDDLVAERFFNFKDGRNVKVGSI